MRSARRTVWLFCLVLGLSGGLAAAQDRLDGQFLGAGEAEGARIEISPDEEGFRGTFYDRAGRSQDFEADRVGILAEAVLDMGGETVLLRMDPKPYGADVALVPIDGAGELVYARARLLTFLRPGLEQPDLPADYVSPPGDARGRIAANSFLGSYEFWPPQGVLNGYLSLAARFRTLMGLFPAVQLDVIFKLCLAEGSDGALGLALKGQGVSCPQVLEGMAQAQRNGRFTAFKREVHAQRDVLRLSVQCGDGYVLPKAECDRAAREVSQQAISLETAATLLARYR